MDNVKGKVCEPCIVEIFLPVKCKNCDKKPIIGEKTKDSIVRLKCRACKKIEIYRG
jgi:ribosomal protein S27E